MGKLHNIAVFIHQVLENMDILFMQFENAKVKYAGNARMCTGDVGRPGAGILLHTADNLMGQGTALG
ncbi:hypothetical protein HRG_014822 [Hirsutella rhossiliensis]